MSILISKEPIGLFSVRATMEISKKGTWKGRELMYGQMEKHTEANGQRISFQGMGNFIGLMALTTKEHTRTIKDMARVP